MELNGFYQSLAERFSHAPSNWADSCTHQECTLHQLSPYIGKLKSVIARDLIEKYSEPGHLVVDMFCGSGTIPLEAACLGRRVFASDSSRYAITLTKGKLTAPTDLTSTLMGIDQLLTRVETLAKPDLRQVPKWVRAFFHPNTLKETLRLVRVLRQERRYFLLGSLLGILHHQRPGFLSYPSSHLVPYLRSLKYPKFEFPELYEYRALAPRLKAKVTRSLTRKPSWSLPMLVDGVRLCSAETVKLPDNIDCVVTSPPYMNALDYKRDNRLRLWFLEESTNERPDRTFATLERFRRLVYRLVSQLEANMRRGGFCVFVVGDQTLRGGEYYPSEVLTQCFLSRNSRFVLHEFLTDVIPDIRRSRKHLAGIRQENILVFRKK